MQTWQLSREIPVDDTYDLVVAGGGPAGTAAAICAGRLGAKVLLVEATGCLGGMGTGGLVTAYDPMGNGERPLVGGVMREILDRMDVRGFLGPEVNVAGWMSAYMRWTPFQGEGLKLVLDEMASEAGVEVRFFTRVIDADAAYPAVRGVVLHNIEGYSYVPARACIDATGDAVLADLCGVPCREAGRDTPNIMPCTLASQHANIDWAAEVSQQWQLIVQAVDNGHFTQPDYHLPGLSRVGKTLGYLNGGHVFNCNALYCHSLSDGMRQGRKIVREYLDFFRQYVPGCAEMELTATGALLGVRETRRIVGEYELTLQDFLARRQFPDQIGVFNKFVDIHPYNCSKEEFARFMEEKDRSGKLEPGECFGIPYGMLVPRGWHNLWVAGRCSSSDIPMHGTIRVMPAATMMGQAAGTAAVQSLQAGQPACDLDTAALVTALRTHGAYLPQDALSRVMTRQPLPT